MTSKRIVHVCTFPGVGGAGIATQRLVRGLRNAGADATLVGFKGSEELPWVSRVAYSNSISEKVWRRYRKFQMRRTDLAIAQRKEPSHFFSSDRCPHGAALAHSLLDADLVHLHWVCNLIDYSRTLAAIPDKTPVFWTLHDMGVFTGGCSHSFDCDEYTRSCGSCPQLLPEFKNEAAMSLVRRQKAMLSIRDRLTVIGPSKWIVDKSSRGNVLGGVPHHVVANGIDLEVFHPQLRDETRRRLQFPPEKFVILFVAAGLDVRLKGMSILREALSSQGMQEQIEICFVGPESEQVFPDSWRWLGMTKTDREIASIYSAADLLVVPSLADNFPNVICEALASGLPVVGSRIGGIPELIHEDKTGFLFEPGHSAELTRCIRSAVTKVRNARSEWSHRCRKQAESGLGLQHCVEKHQGLYADVLGVSDIEASDTAGQANILPSDDELR